MMKFSSFGIDYTPILSDFLSRSCCFCFHWLSGLCLISIEGQISMTSTKFALRLTQFARPCKTLLASQCRCTCLSPINLANDVSSFGSLCSRTFDVILGGLSVCDVTDHVMQQSRDTTDKLWRHSLVTITTHDWAWTFCLISQQWTVRYTSNFHRLFLRGSYTLGRKNHDNGIFSHVRP